MAIDFKNSATETQVLYVPIPAASLATTFAIFDMGDKYNGNKPLKSVK